MKVEITITKTEEITLLVENADSYAHAKERAEEAQLGWLPPDISILDSNSNTTYAGKVID